MADETNDWIAPPAAAPIDDWAAPPAADGKATALSPQIPIPGYAGTLPAPEPPTVDKGETPQEWAENWQSVAEPWRGVSDENQWASDLQRVAKGTPAEGVANLVGKYGSRAINALGATFGSLVNAGAATSYDIARSTGLSVSDADRLKRTIQGMPEAFAGSPEIAGIHAREAPESPPALAATVEPKEPGPLAPFPRPDLARQRLEASPWAGQQSPAKVTLDSIASGPGNGAPDPKGTLDSIATTGHVPAPESTPANPNGGIRAIQAEPNETGPGFWGEPEPWFEEPNTEASPSNEGENVTTQAAPAPRIVNIPREINGEPVTFPDKNHADLYDLGQRIAQGDRGPAVDAEAARLYGELGGYTEDVHSPADVRDLAADYHQSMNDNPSADPRHNSVIDPDEIGDYHRDRIIPRLTGEMPEEVAPLPRPMPASPPDRIQRMAQLQTEREAEARGERVAGSPAQSFEAIANAAPPAGFVPVRADTAQAIASDGTRVPVQYGIMDARSIVPSHTNDLRPNPDYPPGLQPRDRTRATTETQIASMLNPDRFQPALLGESPDAANGAPIVGRDGLVESGNARTIALRRAYEQNLPAAQMYRDYLEKQGYPVGDIEQPVLVRMNQAPMSGPEREAFARAANKPAVLQMSAPERAVADARALPGATLEMARDGDLLSAANRPFVTSVLKHIATPEEMGAIVDSEGRISAEGLRRVQGVILAKAYGDPGLLQTLLEATDSNIKAIGNALLGAAPRWAKMVEEARSGQIEPSMDITPDLMAAVKVVGEARDKEMSIGELVRSRENQAELFSGKTEPLPPRTRMALEWLAAGEDLDKRVGQAKMTTALRFYTEEALKSQPGEGLFGTKAEPEPLIRAARDRAQGPSDQTGDLLAQRQAGPGTGGDGTSDGTGGREIQGPEASAPGVAGDQGEPYRPKVIERDANGRPIRREPVQPGATERLERGIADRARDLREEPEEYGDGRREPTFDLTGGAAKPRQTQRIKNANAQTVATANQAAKVPGNAPPVGGGLGSRQPPGGGRVGGTGGGNRPPPRQPQMPLPGGAATVRRNGIVARSWLGKIFSPATVSDTAAEQAGLARREYGKARRTTQQAREGLEQLRGASPNLRTPEGDNLMAYIEGRSGGATLADPAMQPLADKIRALNQDRQRQIAALPQYAQRGFIDDYYAHMWKDPQKAQAAVNTNGGGAWQGSGRNLKGRTIPTYADGIAMGLEPKHANIVDGEMDYLANMDRFLATNRIINRMRANGTAKYFIPGSQPQGWVPLKGILAEKAVPMGTGAAPMKLFAPEDPARVYNNMISKGVYGTDAGPIYDKLLRAKNAQTMVELSLSAFHATTMATEAYISEFGRGLGLIKSGKPLQGAATIAASPAAVVKGYLTGRKVAGEYLEPGSQGAKIGRITDLIAQANASPLGRGESQYFAGTRGAFGKGAQGIRQAPAAIARDMKSAWKEATSDIASRPTARSKAAGVAQYTGQNIARALDTISAPLFDHLIPRLKAGAAAQRISDWMDAHPNASHDEQLAYARDVVDSMDNRFGELTYDNLTWNQAIKQPLFLGLRAMGWDIGTHREIEGGMMDMARGRWTPRTEYVLGLLATYPIMNGVMSYLHTGQAPSGMDFVAYNTGQKDEHGQPIRGLIPGYGREAATLIGNIFAKGFGKAALDYGMGKVASTWTTLGDLMENRDYRGDPIGPPGAGVMTAKERALLPEFGERYLQYIWDELKPISFRDPGNQYEGISPAERVLAVRKAPLALDSPTAAQKYYQRQEENPKGPTERWKAKLKREELERERAAKSAP